jgi:hypothetical protein
MNDYPGYPCALSPCKRYRYARWDVWSPFADARMVNFICLNPGFRGDNEIGPTVRRCIQFAKSWGYDGMVTTNLFAIRTPNDPEAMKACPDPIGADNDLWLMRIAGLASTALVIAAWGKHGRHLQRGAAVSRLVPGMRCLGLTQEGQPRHPFYVPASTQLTNYP